MMIQAFHLTKVHPSGAKVLDDAYFSAAEGSFVVVEGDSRTGKSTFLKMLAGEEKPTAGVLKVDHKDIYALSGAERREWLSGVGMIFPDLELFADKTVEENILFILQVKGASGEGEREAIGRLLSRAGLGDKVQSRPSDLSSAEQSMVLALRSMIFRPRLLLADDPFQGLDANAFSVLLHFFVELHKSGSTVVLSTPPTPLMEELRKRQEENPLRWVRMEKGKFLPMEPAP